MIMRMAMFDIYNDNDDAHDASAADADAADDDTDIIEKEGDWAGGGRAGRQGGGEGGEEVL